jgi:hypothetical protein
MREGLGCFMVGLASVIILAITFRLSIGIAR